MNSETEYYEQFGGLSCGEADEAPGFSDGGNTPPSFSDEEPANFSDGGNTPPSFSDDGEMTKTAGK